MIHPKYFKDLQPPSPASELDLKYQYLALEREKFAHQKRMDEAMLKLQQSQRIDNTCYVSFASSSSESISK